MAAIILGEPVTGAGYTPGEYRISLAEIVSALSFALDLTEGAIRGHALRTCLLGMRIGQEMGLSSDAMISLYYASLLKDVGCGNAAARLCEVLGGAEARRARGGMGSEDCQTAAGRAAARRLLESIEDPPNAAARRATGNAPVGKPQFSGDEQKTGLRAERSTEILRKLDLAGPAAEAVRCLDEHWDGSGFPEGLMGAEIPLESRIIAAAQHLDLFASRFGITEAIRTLRQRSGSWFDPVVVWTANWLHCKALLWTGAMPDTPEEQTREVALELAPMDIDQLEAGDIDLICEAFADVVDAKSHFTYRHSRGVTDIAVQIALRMGLSDERVRLVHRAALLHDIGKLRVPNSILDKPGKLDGAEWDVVQDHPRLTREILLHVESFRELALVAGAHHERLDGSGYPERLRGEEIPLESRIIAVADVYDALTEDRPYRSGMSHDRAMEIMLREAPGRLDAACCAALFGGNGNVLATHPRL